MSQLKSKATATDWTKLLADPDLARNLGKLLQSYRDAPADKREEVLLTTMRAIKKESAERAASPSTAVEVAAGVDSRLPSTVPPFEPDIFGLNWGDDRRRHPRIRCFVAVELRVNNSDTPIWGNLSNTSRGGCQVETAAPITAGAKVEIGLWVASGKIWVKGLAINGVVTRSAASGGARLRFDSMDSAEKENLRQFLKYVQDTTRESHTESSYLQLLK